jgi:hypothetical protein
LDQICSLDIILTVIVPSVAKYVAFGVQTQDAEGYRDYRPEYRSDDHSIGDRFWVMEVWSDTWGRGEGTDGAVG